MGLVTGTTQDKLHLVKTYNPSQPYVVGVNGVTAVNLNDDGNISSVEYIIDGIKYTTRLTIGINPVTTTSDVQFRRPNNVRSFIPNGIDGVVNNDVLPTTFEYTTQPVTTNDFFVFKDDVKMGVVFSPKVFDDVFIERQRISVFETQSRLSEIRTLEDLEEYNNGFYNVIKTN